MPHGGRNHFVHVQKVINILIIKRESEDISVFVQWISWSGRCVHKHLLLILKLHDSQSHEVDLMLARLQSIML